MGKIAGLTLFQTIPLCPLGLWRRIYSTQSAGMAPRRSQRPHPRIHTSEDGARIARRRRPRLHPQILASEEGAGVTCRRSPRFHPQIHASKEGAGMAGRIRRRGTSPVELASLPDDMLREILLRLPPQPSSLPRASAVCRRWQGLITDPEFPCSFRDHHREPPLLGVFQQNNEGIPFIPILDPPDRVPPVRFCLGRCNSDDYFVIDCRYGQVLVHNYDSSEVVVCDPITGDQRRVALPPEFKRFTEVEGTVLCAAGDICHGHGGFHSSPFKVVLITIDRIVNRPTVGVYFSETGIWGNLISTESPYQLGGITGSTPPTLIGNALYWLSRRDHIVEFDLDGQSLAVIKGPPVKSDINGQTHRIILAEDGDIGFAVLSYPHFHIWQRNVNGHLAATWVLRKTIEMHTILGLPSDIATGWEGLIGYVEDTHVVFLDVCRNAYMVQLKSRKSRKLYENMYVTGCHPFRSFYTPGTAINGGSNGAEMLLNT